MPDLVYSSAVQSLISAGSERNRNATSHLLASLSLDSLFPDGFVDRNAALGCHAGLWLRHEFLDEAHSICQDIRTREGSFWHAIVHRMEKDYWNSKYWYQRVGQHPVHDPLVTKVAQLNEQDLAGLIVNNRWDPSRFVDFCEHADEKGSHSIERVRLVRNLEWQLLFDFCWNAANGK